MSWEAHAEVVAIAIAEVDALKNRLLAAAEKQQEALGGVVLAVGDPAPTESGRNATEAVALIGEMLGEVLNLTHHAVAELTRYQGGF